MAFFGSAVSAPDWFALRFEGGEVLRVFDDIGGPVTLGRLEEHVNMKRGTLAV